MPSPKLHFHSGNRKLRRGAFPASSYHIRSPIPGLTAGRIKVPGSRSLLYYAFFCRRTFVVRYFFTMVCTIVAVTNLRPTIKELSSLSRSSSFLFVMNPSSRINYADVISDTPIALLKVGEGSKDYTVSCIPRTLCITREKYSHGLSVQCCCPRPTTRTFGLKWAEFYDLQLTILGC